ncbi:GTP-binding protein that may be involved in cell development (By similarity) [Musa troglodytarum]|uniref:GTP-binding protein that may be involved in cell development By similarity n=1 Tax=Musa troglodytarum TaxID=320322 RepID=A0A9E7F4Y2_9LILI|nr:GTP-binding protein that may be involved in cell development (By similarity) [Musa troglodytarum]
MGEDCAATQLIDANRAFNVDGLDRFLKAVKLADYGLSYAVVSIIGPQSSGESGRLPRSLFVLRGTEFLSQTTKGIWIAKGVGIEPCTIVLDLEGTDARERGETPLEHLEQVLREDIQQIWDTVYRPQAHEETPLSEFFNGVLQVIDEVSFLLQDFPLAYGRFGKLYEKIRTLTFLLIRYDMETFYFDDGVRTAKRQQLESKALHKKITEALVQPVELLFDSAAEDIWASIRELYRHETENAMSGFSTVFSHDKNSMPRVWTGKEDVRKITEEARAVALKFLAAMAAIRLDDQPDKIENILSSSLMDGPVIKDRTIEAFRDPLAASTWEGVPPENTVITPVQCKSIWKQFKVETESTVSQAISSQEAFKRNNSWLPPPWAIVTIAVLGFNEFMMLLRNPLYLAILFILFILSRVVWYELNIAGEFQNVTLSGLLAISTRFLPSVLNILRRVAGEGHRHHQGAQSSQQSLPSAAHAPRNQEPEK